METCYTEQGMVRMSHTEQDGVEMGHTEQGVSVQGGGRGENSPRQCGEDQSKALFPGTVWGEGLGRGEHSQWGVDEMITLWNRVEVGSGVHGGKGEHTHRQRGEGGSMTFLEQCGTLKLVQGGGRPEHSPMRWGEDPSITILEQCCAGKLVQGLRRADHRLQHNYSGAMCMVGGGQITVPGSGVRNPA